MSKLHKTTKQVRTALLSSVAVTLVIAVMSLILFTWSVVFGLAMFVAVIVWAMTTLMIQIKLHARYTQELILKIHGKGFYEYCECDSCTAARGKGQKDNLCENKNCKKYHCWHPNENCEEIKIES